MGVTTRKDSAFFGLYLEQANGRGRKVSTKIPVDAPTAAERKANHDLAEQVYLQMMAEQARTGAGLASAKPSITFAAYAAWYLEHISARKRDTGDREAIVLAHWIDLLGSTPLHLIDQTTIIEGRTARLRHVKPATVNRELDVIKHMLGTAVPKYLSRNPLDGFRRLHAEAVDIRTLQGDEDQRLLRVAEDSPKLRALILLGLDCLLRLGDVASLRWSQVELKRIQIPRPKGGKPYWVFMSRRLRAALDQIPRTGTYVFQSPVEGLDQPIARRTIQEYFLDACAQAGIPTGRADVGMTYHALRHTGATWALNSGVNPRAVQEMGGWTSMRMLERYGHSSDSERQRATDAISGEQVRSMPRLQNNEAS